MTAFITKLRAAFAALVLIVAGAALVAVAPDAQATPACRQVLLAGSQWLGGHGVDVHSNGQNQGTGNSCGSYTKAHPTVQDGWAWQCVELVSRLYAVRGWGTVGTGGNGGAYYIPEGSPSLTFHRNGSGYIPVPGDLVIYNTTASNPYGHVSVVDSVSGARVNVVEENASWTARGTLTLSGSTLSGGIRGVVHSPLNVQKLPTQPASPKVKSTTGTSAVLTWKDTSNNESNFVTQYRIGTGKWAAGPTAAANATSVTVTGLKPGKTYTFQVGAHNAKGTKWSAYVTGKTVALPTQPASAKVKSTTSSSAVLAWKDASNNESSFVTQYRIGTGKWAAGPTTGANATSVTVRGLVPGNAYTFQIGARNVAGTTWSAYATGTTVQVLPAQPTHPRVASTSTTKAVLAWTDASNNESSFVTQYRIGTGKWTAGPSAAANATSVTVTGLKAGTAYTFQIGAHNTKGTHWSAYAYGTTAAQSAPPQPSTGYHTGRQITIDKHATNGVSGHRGPSNSYATGPTHAANSALWIVCYVTGQSITGPYDTTTIWDLSNDGYYYTDAWLYTGTNGAAVPHC